MGSGAFIWRIGHLDVRGLLIPSCFSFLNFRLDVLVYDYLQKRRFHSTAESLLNAMRAGTESNQVPRLPPQMDLPDSILLEWFISGWERWFASPGNLPPGTLPEPSPQQSPGALATARAAALSQAGHLQGGRDRAGTGGSELSATGQPGISAGSLGSPSRTGSAAGLLGIPPDAIRQVMESLGFNKDVDQLSRQELERIMAMNKGVVGSGVGRGHDEPQQGGSGAGEQREREPSPPPKRRRRGSKLEEESMSQAQLGQQGPTIAKAAAAVAAAAAANGGNSSEPTKQENFAPFEGPIALEGNHALPLYGREELVAMVGQHPNFANKTETARREFVTERLSNNQRDANMLALQMEQQPGEDAQRLMSVYEQRRQTQVRIGDSFAFVSSFGGWTKISLSTKFSAKSPPRSWK